jgi:hypothetical protein
MQLLQAGCHKSTRGYDIATREGRARVQSAQPKAKGKGKSSIEITLNDRNGAPLNMSIKGGNVCVSLVLLVNASRMEELRNLWNDARVVSELSDEGQTMDRQVLPAVPQNTQPKPHAAEWIAKKCYRTCNQYFYISIIPM